MLRNEYGEGRGIVMGQQENLASTYLAEAIAGMRALKELADKAIAQASDDDLFRQLDDEANSIAVIVRHIAGNMRSRWTDFLTSDGEKPDRHRDQEFEIPPTATRSALLAEWEGAWSVTLRAIESLDSGDLLRTVTIRGEPHSVLRAIERQTRHYAQHVGQIVLLAKHWRGSAWTSLSIPRGKSAEYSGPIRA
jgi:hypothetical protein